MASQAHELICVLGAEWLKLRTRTHGGLPARCQPCRRGERKHVCVPCLSASCPASLRGKRTDLALRGVRERQGQASVLTVFPFPTGAWALVTPSWLPAAKTLRCRQPSRRKARLLSKESAPATSTWKRKLQEDVDHPVKPRLRAEVPEV